MRCAAGRASKLLDVRDQLSPRIARRHIWISLIWALLRLPIIYGGLITLRWRRYALRTQCIQYFVLLYQASSMLETRRMHGSVKNWQILQRAPNEAMLS